MTAPNNFIKALLLQQQYSDHGVLGYKSVSRSSKPPSSSYATLTIDSKASQLSYIEEVLLFFCQVTAPDNVLQALPPPTAIVIMESPQAGLQKSLKKFEIGNSDMILLI